MYRNLVHGYRVYRSIDGDAPVEIGSTGPGVTEYTDQDITDTGGLYVYDVRAFDSDNEAMLGIEPGSAEDIARTVTPVPLPRHANGVIDIDDFFLFAESFSKAIANAAEVQDFIAEAGTSQAINDAIVFRIRH